MEARPAPTAPVRTLEDVRRAFEEEMAREDRELLVPLLDRMTQVAELVTEGRPVDPEFIRSGIRLWARFVNELHDRRIRRLIEMIPPNAEFAGVEPLAESRFRLPMRRRRDAVPDPALVAEYLGVRGEQARMAERLRELETFVEMYRTGGFYARQLLGSLMRSGAFSDRAWVQYEEQFVERRLKERLPPRADAGLSEEVAAEGRGRTALEGAVRAFLAQPIPFQAAETPPATAPPPPEAPAHSTPRPSARPAHRAGA